MTTSETYLHSWEKELKDSLKQQEQKQKQMEEIVKKIKHQREDHTNQLKALQDNLQLITEQMKTSLRTYSETLMKRLEKLDDTKDLKIQGEVLFTIFKALYDEACLFFSRNQFQVLSSPLQEAKDINVVDMWKSLWKERLSLEDENWLSYKNSIWSLKVYHEDMVRQLDQAEKDNLTLLEKEKVILQQKTKIDIEVRMIQKQLSELSTFSEKMKQVQQEVEDEALPSSGQLVISQRKPEKSLSPIPEDEKTDRE
jgi:hypothetical protein